MPEIKLTREEKRELEAYLRSDLDMKAEYHSDLYPEEDWNLDTLMRTYFYWGDNYNDNYIPEERYVDENKMSAYLVQEFKKFMAIPVSVRY